MAKIKTNTDRFKDFAKNSDSILLAVTRAIMVHNAERVIKNQEQVKEEYKNSLISGDLVIRSAEEVIRYLGFED